ncbi:stability/partitioning determinant [Salmonella enterica]|nr:stability/partitioning determinant [Salmonella enterica]
MSRLRKPRVPEAPEKSDQTQTATSFIAAGDRRPATGKPQIISLRLPEETMLALDNITERSGQKNRTLLVKAAILALASMDGNEQNTWLLEAMKI